ncbi:hypothetical protein K435DRAFT_856726 [Dendrothele bispora CBS 962.96]|uniref:Ig-like domain-containing protein n=1 Tax=Dendrothele bispora (strain CBS 962.96) TaxID=1314807 RepID=A0A4S8M930_DENBC|nr:hypothetical protein K435DRAFT_856726 [Dendrothele bispora CBS 962.96]
MPFFMIIITSSCTDTITQAILKMYTSPLQIYAPDYPVKSVTVFKSYRAEVVRTFEIDLKVTFFFYHLAGQNKIEILGLPNAIDRESVRVSGKKGSTELRLYDFVCTITESPPTLVSSSTTNLSKQVQNLLVDSLEVLDISETTDPEETLRILKVRLASLQSQQKVREQEADLLMAYSGSLSAQYAPPCKKQDGGEGFSIGKFLDDFLERGRKNVEASIEIKERIVEVERKIKEVKERVEKRKGKRNARVDIVLSNSTLGGENEGTGKAEVKLSYIVSNASWEPTYELHATTSPTTGKPIPKVSLRFSACVTQSTGEDWTDASLTLSTVFSSYRSSSRVLGPWSMPLRMPILKGVQIRRNENRNELFQNTAFGTSNNFNKGWNAFGSGNGNNGALHVMGPPLVLGGGSSFGSAPIQQRQQQQQQPGGAGTFGGGVFGGGGSGFGTVPPQRMLPSQPPQQQQQPPREAGAFGGSAFGASTGFGSFGSSPQLTARALAPGQPSFGGAAQSQSTSDQPRPASRTAFDGDFEQVEYPVDGAPNTDIPLPTGATFGNSEEEVGSEAGQNQSTTTVVETPLAMTYSVQGKAMILSDGVKHQVPVAVLVFGGEGDGEGKEKKEGEKEKEDDVVIEYGVVPRLDTRVYLQCRVKNTSEYRLLPGPVSVILDDGHITKTSIGDININDTFTCTLGADPTTQVKYTRTSRSSRSQAGSFTEAFNVTTYNTKVVVSNKHSFDLKDLRVYDCVPVYEDKKNANEHKVSVVLRQPEGLAHAKEGQEVIVPEVKANATRGRKVNVMWQKAFADGSGGEKAGKLEWKVEVAAGKTETLGLEWEVKAPVGAPLVESVVQ